MKHILLGFVISLIFINVQAQSIDSSILLQDGTIVDCSHVFIDGEMPTFHAQNGSCENSRWAFSVYDKNGKKIVCEESKTGATSFSFKITPSLFSGLNLVSDCQNIEYPNDSSVYISCVVDLHKNGIITSSLPLRLNVLPSRPKKKNASILGNFNFDLSSYYPSAELTIQFSSDRMKDCLLVQFFSDNLDVFEFPEEGYWGLYIGVDINEKSKNFYEIKYNYADWGEFYKIVSCNEYGSSSGDTIFTNSLIKNPEILNYLETIRNQTSAIDVVPNMNGQISIQNNKIILEGFISSKTITEIYSANGALVKKCYSTKTIDLNDLCSGLYIVKVISGNKNKYIKINKK